MTICYVLLAVLILFASCSRSHRTDRPLDQVPARCSENCIGRDTAILIAKGDAFKDYDLRQYDVVVEEQSNAWQIAFKFKDPSLVGGEPEYLIDKATGKILRARYYK